MPVRYDPLIARVLAREILDRWKGAPLASLRMERARRVVELGFADGSRLVALLHPEHGHLLALEPADPPLDLGGAERRFRSLALAEAQAPADERALLLTFTDRSGRPRQGLGIELQTQRLNAVHVSLREDASAPGPADAAWRIETVLLSRVAGDRSLRRGAGYALPASTRSAIEAPPGEDDWMSPLGQAADDERRGAVLRTWAWTSTLNVDWILGPVGEGADPGRALARYLKLHGLAARLAGPGPMDTPVWVHERRWGPQPYPHPLDAKGQEAAGMLDAMRRLIAASGGIEAALGTLPAAAEPAADDEAARLARKLESRRKRLSKRIAALARQLEAAGPPEEPQAIGQLLLARKDEIRKGASTVALEDFDGSIREIELDPARDPVANAGTYFDEARRRRRALERLPGQIAEAEAGRDELDAWLARLAETGPSPELWKVVGGRPPDTKPGRAPGPAAESRLPYTRLMTSGGREIRVGRGARDNDDLTFRHSAPDDIWLHASQSSGAHVILRWGRKDENPPRRDLIEAATVAAVNSGARHSGTVPVVWTRRKYVRKPRKSPPGTVVPDRVQTIFVEPDQALVASLRPS